MLDSSSILDAGSSLIGSSKSEVIGSSVDLLKTLGSSAFDILKLIGKIVGLG